MASAPHHVLLLITLSAAFDACSYDGRVSWDGPKAFLALLPCDATDPHSQWAGATLSDGAAASEITNGAACVGACLDLRGGGGPTVELWTCHPAGDADAPNQQWTYEADGTIRSPKNPGKLGRYTSANLFVNGTWWTGSYGLGLSSKTNSLSIEIGPFVGFRHSVDGGATWKKPMSGGAELNVSRTSGASAADAPPAARRSTANRSARPRASRWARRTSSTTGPRTCGAPTARCTSSPGGCLRRANENCTWISGDGIFLARASFDAADPDSLNDASNWEFMGVDGWVGDADDAKPAFEWEGRRRRHGDLGSGAARTSSA
ncbi:hypothetical protein JL722_5257 [Aureococcus anophagefferens]|nr:hypothetical protein JL722_5257 [Aureococcus anophagefferens]